ncbi:MAG: ROK family protein [Alistipes sp.]|nr:ROK family protein [Alistipes sp.]MBR3702171.1 ROK family protein [Alistipes sp.]
MKKLAMGIDIGGTNTAFGLVDEEGTIFCESAISTERYKKFDDYEAYVKTLCESMKALISSVSFDFELIGIGIGAPNANYHKGTIETPANLWKFRDDEPNPDESRRMFYFVEDVQKYFPGVQVLITNDANAAAIGEGVFGNAKGMKDYVVITLGTGLGSGIVSNGEMIYGHDGFAGEYGHIMVDSRVTGRECGCGRRGCLEAYASATGIKRTAFELMAKLNCDSELRDTPYSKFEAVMLSIAADKGDPIAKEAFRYTGEVLGKALADLVATTSPEAIILFGGLAKAGKYIFEPTKWYMEENMLPTFKNKVQLLPSGIEGKNAAILGSSALIWQKQQK